MSLSVERYPVVSNRPSRDGHVADAVVCGVRVGTWLPEWRRALGCPVTYKPPQRCSSGVV